MDFTLRYSGEMLGPTSRKKKAKLQHEMRRRFHSQLADLWGKHPLLHSFNPKQFQFPVGKRKGRYRIARPINPQAGGFFFRVQVGGYDLVPLVTFTHESHCHLSIRLFRHLERDEIVYGGQDVDNVLKTLCDALSMPRDESAVKEKWRRGLPKTFFCLLEDDKLITRATVESRTLLTPQKTSVRNYVDLDIDVHIEPITPFQGNVGWLFP